MCLHSLHINMFHMYMCTHIYTLTHKACFTQTNVSQFDNLFTSLAILSKRLLLFYIHQTFERLKMRKYTSPIFFQATNNNVHLCKC